jgi:hypothetical protein
MGTAFAPLVPMYWPSECVMLHKVCAWAQYWHRACYHTVQALDFIGTAYLLVPSFHTWPLTEMVSLMLVITDNSSTLQRGRQMNASAPWHCHRFVWFVGS